jgi:hypothetical protein
MEILFANSYVRNKELAREIYRHYYFHRKLYIVLDILVMLSFLANLIITILQGAIYWTGIILPLLFFLLQFYGYFSQVNLMVKRDAEVCGNEISVETVVTDAFIQNTASTGAVNRLEFDKIRSAAQTKNLILLRSKANLIYIFRKDTFTIGTKEEFIAFLKEKGIKV